jgi:hypothetical protein
MQEEEKIRALLIYPWGKNLSYLLDRRLSGLWSQSGQYGEFLTLLGLKLRPLGHPARSQINIKYLTYIFKSNTKPWYKTNICIQRRLFS